MGSGIPSALFGGRIFGPILGIWVWKKAGLKATFVTGLGVYCTGALMFWPSGYLRSYYGFVVSNFVVGFGLASVLMAAYSFLALCGPAHRAEYRLCLATSVWAVADVLAGIFVKYLFANIIESRTFVFVQWTYIASVIATTLLHSASTTYLSPKLPIPIYRPRQRS